MRAFLAVVVFSSIILSGAPTLLAQQTRGMRNVIRDPETGSDIVAYNDSWAILVGIDKYQKVPPLSYAVSDAGALKKLLVETFDFKDDHITLLTDENATLDKIKKAFGDLARVGNEDRVVVFFAGHGETYDRPTGGQMGYLIPVEGKAGSPSELFSTCLSMQYMKELAEYSPAKHILFLVDACYSGLAASGTRALKKDVRGYIKKLSAAPTHQILTAGSKGETVQERSDWGHSAFTYVLLQGLGRGLADYDNNGVIQADELAVYVQQKVAEITGNKQNPQFRRLLDNDEGEFLFILPEITASAPAAEGAAPTVLSVTSDQPGASILIDGRTIGKVTPSEIGNLPEGQHTVELRKGNFSARQVVALAKAQRLALDMTLELAKGSLSVTSFPAGAQVFMEDSLLGTAPVMIPAVPSGRHTVIFRKAGFLPDSNVVDVWPFAPATVNGRLYRPATLIIKSDPPGCEVTLDGRVAGVTPLEIPDCRPGEVALRITSPDYSSWREDVVLPEGQRKELTPKLVARFGFLTAKGTPGTSLVLDGKAVDIASAQGYKVPVGRHRVQFRHPDFSREINEVVDFEPGREKTMEARFGTFSLNAAWRSALFPGWGQVYDGAGFEGGMFIAGTLAAVTFSALMETSYLEKVNEYNTAKDEYTAAQTTPDAVRLRGEMTSKYTDAQNTMKSRDLGYLVTAGVYGLSLLDALLFHSKGVDYTLMALGGSTGITPLITCSPHRIGCGVAVNF